jgi:hypothetical protein
VVGCGVDLVATPWVMPEPDVRRDVLELGVGGDERRLPVRWARATPVKLGANYDCLVRLNKATTKFF